MGHRSTPGFTLVEVILALIVLVVGVLTVAGSSALATRMVGLGRQATASAQVATSRIEWLRGLAASTVPPCAHPQFAGGSGLSGDIQESWSIAGSGNARDVTVVMTYPTPRGPAHDTATAVLLCRPLP